MATRLGNLLERLNAAVQGAQFPHLALKAADPRKGAEGFGDANDYDDQCDQKKQDESGHSRRPDQ